LPPRGGRGGKTSLSRPGRTLLLVCMRGDLNGGDQGREGDAAFAERKVSLFEDLLSFVEKGRKNGSSPQKERGVFNNRKK